MVDEIKANPKWLKQKQKLDKAQLLFEFIDNIDRKIKLDAIEKGSTPPNIIREVLGLQPSASKRPRVGVSMSVDDLEILAKRYGLDSSDKRTIKRRATEEIQAFYGSQNKKEN